VRSHGAKQLSSLPVVSDGEAPQHHAHNQQLFARAAELIPGSISGVP
jgi:hypothetical protein